MTAELVMAIPMLVALTAGLVWLLSVAFAQVRMIDAARETARALARGDDQASALALGHRVAPAGAHFTITESDGLVRVRATCPVGGPGTGLALVPGVELSAQAVALLEDEP